MLKIHSMHVKIHKIQFFLFCLIDLSSYRILDPDNEATQDWRKISIFGFVWYIQSLTFIKNKKDYKLIRAFKSKKELNFFSEE